MKTEIWHHKKVFSHYGQLDYPAVENVLEVYPERVVFSPIYFDRRINPDQEEYTSTAMTPQDCQNALMDFISIARFLDDGLPPREVILDFLYTWGYPTGIERIPWKDDDLDSVINNPYWVSHFWTTEEWHEISSDMRDILQLANEGRRVEAIQQYEDRWPLLSAEIRFSNGRTVFIMEDLMSVLNYQLWMSIPSNNPLRNCPVCMKFYQRKITAKQCSDKCKSLKSARKIRSKKK